MAKNSGTTRTSRPKKAADTDVRQQFTDDATSYVQQLMSRSVDYNDRDNKRLQQIIKQGKTYKEGQLEQAIKDYTAAGMRTAGGKFLSIEHANMSGARSEVIKAAQLKKMHDSIPQIQKILNSRSKTNYQNITAIDRTSLTKFAKTLPQHIKDMTNVDISKAIVGTHRKLGGYIDVNFHELKPNEERAVKSYLTKMGYSYEENGATNTAINFKRNYKGK